MALRAKTAMSQSHTAQHVCGFCTFITIGALLKPWGCLLPWGTHRRYVLGLSLQQFNRHPWLVDYQHGEAAIRALSKTLELPELSNLESPPAEPGVYLREINSDFQSLDNEVSHKYRFGRM